MARKAAPTPVGDRRYQQAMDRFEKAVKAFGRKDFDRAGELLDSLIEAHEDHLLDLVERARAYRAMCDRARGRPARPKSFEELLNYGVVLHNRGEYDAAVRYLRQALEKHPRNEHALYCLAAAQSRAGDLGGALKALRSAINANPASRTQARLDADFHPLRGQDEFQALVAPTLS